MDGVPVFNPPLMRFGGRGPTPLPFLLLLFLRSTFSPAAIYLCSLWYAPADMAARVGGWYVAGACSGIVGGLLAAAITKMDGIGGLEGWRWIFVVRNYLRSCCFLHTRKASRLWLFSCEIASMLTAVGSWKESSLLDVGWYAPCS